MADTVRTAPMDTVIDEMGSGAETSRTFVDEMLKTYPGIQAEVLREAGAQGWPEIEFSGPRSTIELVLMEVYHVLPEDLAECIRVP